MKTKKICIVEDEPLISHAMKMSALGDLFEVSIAKNGEEGLELIRSEKPDLVLIDLMMPKMDGFETIEAIRADDTIKDTKIIVMSNDATAESRDKAEKLEAIDYYVKATSDLTELAERISKIFK